jgi:preprotein translocase subunit Sec63
MSELKFVEVPEAIIHKQVGNNCIHCIMCSNIDYCCFCHKLLLRALEEYDVLSQVQSDKDTDSGYCTDNQSITETDSGYNSDDGECSTDADTNNSH